MTQDQASTELQALGFTEYEARAYLALLQAGVLTGYQLAKASRIPRPNIYPVLDRLEERGAVTRIEVGGGVRYSALPSEEMLRRLGRDVSMRLEKARESMGEMQQAAPVEYVWNVAGYEPIMARARAIIDSARHQLLVGTWSAESLHLSETVARAAARGVDVTTLCIQGCPQECGGCQGEIYRYPLAESSDKRWLILTADDAEIIVAELLPDGSASAAASRAEAFVTVGSHYLRNAIAAAEIVRSLGPRMSKVLDRRALQALRSTGLQTAGESWYERMLSRVAK